MERDGRKKSPDFIKNYFDLNFNSRYLRNHTKPGGYIEKLFKNVRVSQKSLYKGSGLLLGL